MNPDPTRTGKAFHAEPACRSASHHLHVDLDRAFTGLANLDPAFTGSGYLDRAFTGLANLDQAFTGSGYLDRALTESPGLDERDADPAPMRRCLSRQANTDRTQTESTTDCIGADEIRRIGSRTWSAFPAPEALPSSV
jgi:hypothetical protein